MSNRINIVARYNENLDWAKNIDGDILVFNKGSNYIWPYEVIDIENYGREAESFIQAIIYLYETDRIFNYEEFVFLQGNPIEHCNNLYVKLKDEPKSIEFLCNILTTNQTPCDGYIFGNYKSIVNLFMNRINENLNLDKVSIESFTFNFLCDDGSSIDMGNEIEETIFFSKLIGLDCKSVQWRWGNGAQYLVNKKYILNKKLEWWKELHKLVLYISKDLGSDRVAYSLERLWPFIWVHEN
jgi:hypothetical protein